MRIGLLFLFLFLFFLLCSRGRRLGVGNRVVGLGIGMRNRLRAAGVDDFHVAKHVLERGEPGAGRAAVAFVHRGNLQAEKDFN